ncbi:chemotaxis protein CheR [Chitinimonas sp. BJB300]|nr:chemotaxis protein CheR [Chitinimonas sp. BJB300]TSJ87582.1 chemotaxis protein CheR [Chitinimonas sp. BJB300]
MVIHGAGRILGQTEFAFTDNDFEQVRQLIYARAGIALNDSKKPMVYSRLARRLREQSITSVAAYLAMLKKNPDSPEWESFTNALTTNLTAFFREEHHFDALALMAPQWARMHGSIKIWCSASSTGEEPYTIAMTVAEALHTLQPPLQVMASDLDTQVLATASRGIYSVDRIEKLALQRKQRFFLKGHGDNEGMVRIRPELRELITFCQINLLDKAWALSGPFDAIFCRNVMIYFDKATQRAILERFIPLLRPDGRLFVGHSEHLAHVSDLLQPCGRTIYKIK